MAATPQWKRWLVVGLFAAIYSGLSVSSYLRESATWDEPQHLTAGFVAWTEGDYRIDLEHPPLIRMWAALPLVVSRDVQRMPDRLPADIGPPAPLFAYCHQFIYKLNDADRLLYRGRLAVVVLGILLGLLIFSWAFELFGFAAATICLALYCVEPNILAHTRLITTDLGFTLFMVGTIYFLWRNTRHETWRNITGTSLCFSLACVSKFTAVLLGPIVLGLILVSSIRRSHISQPRVVIRRAVLTIGLLAVSTFVAIWLCYGFRYAPGPERATIIRIDQSADLPPPVARVAQVVGWIDDHRLLPNAFSQGFLLGQVKAQRRISFLAGDLSLSGWWYYFPVAFLIKTPLTHLALWGIGLVVLITRLKERWRDGIFLVLPIGAMFAASALLNLNIGLRHILPIYPFVILIAGFAVAEWLRRARHPFVAYRWIIPIALIAAGAELLTVYPHFLAFFNLSVGGPAHGHEYLVDSNLDWGQDLKGLKRWMVANRVDHINLDYFGTADPAYYNIDCTYLSDLPFFTTRQAGLARRPGYLAVSATRLHGVGVPADRREFYRELQPTKPEAIIGHSIFVYRLD